MTNPIKIIFSLTILVILPLISTNAFANLMKSVNLNPHPVPEPVLLLFFGAALISIGGFFKKSIRD